MPAPVAWRSRWMSFAVKFATVRPPPRSAVASASSGPRRASPRPVRRPPGRPAASAAASAVRRPPAPQRGRPAAAGPGAAAVTGRVDLFGRRRGVLAPVVGDEPALDDRVGQDAAHERARTDGVVVARDDVVDDVGVAVGVDHGHDRKPQLPGLGDGDVLLLGVDHEDRVGQPLEIGDAAQVAAQLLQLAGVRQGLALGHALEVTGGLHGRAAPACASPGPTRWRSWSACRPTNAG